MINDHEGPRVVQAWFTGLNPELNDRVPVRLLREENVEAVGPEILGAARAFLSGGKSFLKVPGVIYRLGRKPDSWSVPDWASAGPDGTFGNRFDDPEGMYRVYASSQRLGCFLETLGRFRVDPKLLAELAEIEGEDDYCQLGKYRWNGPKSG
jgi:hypothetical protein